MSRKRCGNRSARIARAGSILWWSCYKGGFPKLSVKQIYNPVTKKLTLTVSQVQKIDTITSAAFILPMDVEFTTAKGTKAEKIQINKRVQTFTFRLEAKPTKTRFDKDEKIPIKSVNMLR